MFEVCKSEQRVRLREETDTWDPTLPVPSSSILLLLPAVSEIKRNKAAKRTFFFFFSPFVSSPLTPGPPIFQGTKITERRLGP